MHFASKHSSNKEKPDEYDDMFKYKRKTNIKMLNNTFRENIP